MKNIILEYQSQKRKKFQKYHILFPRDDLHSLEDYIDLYLIYFGPRYRDYHYDFCILLKKRKISFGTACDLDNSINYRLMTGVYKNFQLGRRSELDQMDGVQFEVFLSKFFLHCGYSVEKTPPSHDYGADLIIQNYSGRFAVQAKRHKKTVGIKAVQEVSSSIPVYHADKAKVITTSKYSRDAVKLAEVWGVELWDGERLKNELIINNFRY